jgi:chromate transporter
VNFNRVEFGQFDAGVHRGGIGVLQTIWSLFTTFVLIGAGAYGGGMVTVPLIQHELVARKHWLTFDEMARIVAIAQMTPGPIAVNAATFVGFRMGGVAGAVAATFGVLLPSLLILGLLLPLIDRFGRSAHGRRIMFGIQIGVLSLILLATWSYGTAAVTGWLGLALAASAFALLVAFEGKVHPMIVVLACGAIGLLIF